VSLKFEIMNALHSVQYLIGFSTKTAKVDYSYGPLWLKLSISLHFLHFHALIS